MNCMSKIWLPITKIPNIDTKISESLTILLHHFETFLGRDYQLYSAHSPVEIVGSMSHIWSLKLSNFEFKTKMWRFNSKKNHWKYLISNFAHLFLHLRLEYLWNRFQLLTQPFEAERGFKIYRTHKSIYCILHHRILQGKLYLTNLTKS